MSICMHIRTNINFISIGIISYEVICIFELNFRSDCISNQIKSNQNKFVTEEGIICCMFLQLLRNSWFWKQSRKNVPGRISPNAFSPLWIPKMTGIESQLLFPCFIFRSSYRILPHYSLLFNSLHDYNSLSL